MSDKRKKRVIVIGGGAAGFMAALTAAEHNPNLEVIILEKGNRVLEKVRISGGGRCNVTHNCKDVRQLTTFYPRGNKELLGPFTQFACPQTIEWFKKRGVSIKAESDGRMFPTTDNSETIIQCFLNEAKKRNVSIRTGVQLQDFHQKNDNQWLIKTNTEQIITDYILLATGSTPSIWKLLASKNIKIIEPVPSLFTFNIADKNLKELMGLSTEQVQLSVNTLKLESSGPLLITHWGFSGPAVLKLSAWGARKFHECGYRFTLNIDWSPNQSLEEYLEKLKRERNKSKLENVKFDPIPNRLWRYFCEKNLVSNKTIFDLSKKDWTTLLHTIHQFQIEITGKSTFKEEFVTAGGISLKEINFKAFEIKSLQNIFAAGEILDIDAVTGGFNFQAAWTGGFIAGKTIGERSLEY